MTDDAEGGLADPVADDAGGGSIPTRDTEWETPFTDPRIVNGDADATRDVGTFSVKRRRIAIAVTALLAMWVLAEIVHVIDLATPSAEEELNALGMLNYGVIFFRLAVGALITWRVWRWANRPLAFPRLL